MRVVTWDLEIAVPVEEVVGGWEAVRRGGAGISVVCLHDTGTGRTHVYDEHDLEEAIEHLNDSELLVGYNTTGFDTPIIESVTGYSLNVPHYDILTEIWRALGSKQKGYKLGEVSERLKLGQKARTGDSAPNLYRNGRMGKLIDYCINDVALTRNLSNWINTNGYILTPTEDILDVNRPGVDA
jgi:DEAD/DEAH box helicase domain-containing protein